MDMPVFVPPMAMQKMAHPEGELGMKQAAFYFNIPYVTPSSPTPTTRITPSTYVEPRTIIHDLQPSPPARAMLCDCRCCHAVVVIV
jgi:hypothetical protein